MDILDICLLLMLVGSLRGRVMEWELTNSHQEIEAPLIEADKREKEHKGEVK